jgi:hypothetical protein
VIVGVHQVEGLGGLGLMQLMQYRLLKVEREAGKHSAGHLKGPVEGGGRR